MTLGFQIPVATSFLATGEEAFSSADFTAHRLRVVESDRRLHVGAMDQEESESEMPRRFRP